MARVKIEYIIEHLDYEMKKALKKAVDKVLPGAVYDSRKLFREFVKAVYRECSIWERVPDRYIEAD